MCKSSTEGGTRCLGHQAGTVATKRYVCAKLNITDKEVGGVISELNREGKNLPAPPRQEVEGWVAREEFKTKLDPELSEHDRKILLKNYQKTREQLDKQGVTGGAFHAWKNAFNRAYDKFRRNFRAITAGGVVVLALAGCGQQSSPPPTADPTTGPVATETAEPTTPPTAPADGELVDQYPEDGTIPLEQVTDEHGTYTRVTVDPNSPLGQFDPANITGSLSQYGFTEDDARRAQELAARFYVEQTMDGPALDNSSVTPEAWYQEASGTLISTDYPASDFQGDNFGGDIMSTGLMPEPLSRDGGQRTEINATVSQIYASESSTSPGSNLITVVISGTADAPLSDTRVVEWARGNFGDQTDALMQEHYPQYLDGNDEGGLRTEMTVTFNFSPESLSQGLIAGHQSDGTAYPIK